MDFIDIAVRFFQQGGIFMYPIAMVLAIGLAIALERWVYLSSSKRSNQKTYRKIIALLSQNTSANITSHFFSLVKGEKTSIGKIITAGLTRMHQSKRRQDVELAMEESVLEVVPKLEKRTAYLATLANIATLLGLLGTIMGLIAAFTAVADAQPAEKASLLSSSISIAMNTTAFGLISAIPLLLFHSILQTKTVEIINSLEMAGIKCLNHMYLDQVEERHLDKQSGQLSA